MADIQYLLIISVALLAIASPGPATLAISSMSMALGVLFGLAAVRVLMRNSKG